MSDTRYKIVFDGQLMPEMALETVKDNLARLFKSDPARIENLFSGAPVALKAAEDAVKNELQRAVSYA